MLSCVPKSICSWDYYIYGASLGPAEVTFNFFLEQGKVSFDRSELSVQKQGLWSGRWTLEEHKNAFAEAQKPSAFFRSFRIQSNDLEFSLEAQSAFTRFFNLLVGGEVVGEIRPVHAFTRRATIECASSIPETLQLFSFWLVLLTWRRAARDNNSVSS